MDLRGHEELTVEAEEPHLIRLEPYGYRWFRVDTVNYAVSRQRA